MANILLVDDDAAVLRTLSRILTTDGHQVQTAKSCSEARQRASAAVAYDVFILDFWLGNDNGLALMGDLLEQHPHTPTLFLSGGNQALPLETSTALAEMQGAAEFLYKPVAAADLLAAVKRQL